ncbi:MAG: hypothetical protein RLO80_00630 [Hyphomonas sp.]
MRTLALISALALSACATGPAERDWTSNPGAQPFATAVAACNQISYNVEANFVTCMAGRGWSKVKK